MDRLYLSAQLIADSGTPYLSAWLTANPEDQPEGHKGKGKKRHRSPSPDPPPTKAQRYKEWDRIRLPAPQFIAPTSSTATGLLTPIASSSQSSLRPHHLSIHRSLDVISLSDEEDPNFIDLTSD